MQWSNTTAAWTTPFIVTLRITHFHFMFLDMVQDVSRILGRAIFFVTMSCDFIQSAHAVKLI